jgi:hypothetical protein
MALRMIGPQMLPAGGVSPSSPLTMVPVKVAAKLASADRVNVMDSSGMVLVWLNFRM